MMNIVFRLLACLWIMTACGSLGAEEYPFSLEQEQPSQNLQKKMQAVIETPYPHVERSAQHYRYQLAVAAIFHNDANYLREWIEFHLLVGVQHFYLFNHLSTDHYSQVLKPYIDRGVVQLIDWPFPYEYLPQWNHIQNNAYKHAIGLAQGQAKWVAFIDTDEFLFPVKKKNLVKVLKDYEQYGALAANWQVFGTSGVAKIPKSKLLIETLVLRSPLDWHGNRHVKSIVRPERVADCKNPHFFAFHRNYYQVNEKKEKFKYASTPYTSVTKIRINHYSSRDQYYLYNIKIPRWQKWGVDTSRVKEEEGFMNQLRDESILRFVPALKKRMAKTG